MLTDGLIATGMVLLVGAMLGFAFKKRNTPWPGSRITRHVVKGFFWIAVILWVVVLTVSLKSTPGIWPQQHKKLVPVSADRIASGKAAPANSVDVDRRYAEIAGHWSDVEGCQPGSGSTIHLNADGLDFGHSHFHVETMTANERDMILRGHYVRHSGVKDEELRVTVLSLDPPKILLSGKLFFGCP